MSASLTELLASTALYGGNAAYVESLYEQYLADPSQLDADWRELFAKLPPVQGSKGGSERAHSPVIAALAARAQLPLSAAPVASVGEAASEKQAAVSRLVQIYGNRGHLIAKIDPLNLMPRPRPHVLELGYTGLAESDLATEFYTGSTGDWMPKRATLREIIATLEQTYCGVIGAEFAHVSNSEERLWLQDQFQEGRKKQSFNAEEKKQFLWRLTAAEGLERYLHTRYVSQKRFSLEGGESLIPLLDDLIQESGRGGIEEVVVAMAHRGRLNVLINTLGKSPAQLFSEFEGKYEVHGAGDVKYHKGFSSDLRTPGGNVHVMLAFNPSHLEIVNPVAEGSVRARQERRGDANAAKRSLPDTGARRCGLCRPGRGDGDAADVADCAATAPADRFTSVINNQVGFTIERAATTRARPLYSQRCGEDDRGADPARQRRRSGSGDLCGHGFALALSPELPQGHRHRPGVLPAARPQRGGRTGRDAAR